MVDRIDASRINRDMTTRSAEANKKTWTPPSVLPEPKPRPGWAHKYVRVSAMGAADPANVSSKFREGWEPVRAEDYPELKYFADAGSESKFKDNIEIGGLLLCRTPQENVEARREYHDTLNQKQLEGVDNNFYRQRDAKTNMELFTERKSSVSFGRGNRT